MSYLEKFTAYAPELGEVCQEIGRSDLEVSKELETDEPTSAAFNVCEAFTVFWAQWHGGMSSRLYSLGSRFEREFHFNPRPGLSEDTLDETTQEILRLLPAAFKLHE